MSFLVQIGAITPDAGVGGAFAHGLGQQPRNHGAAFAGVGIMRGPGSVNFDFTLAKDGPVAIQPMMLLRPGGAVTMRFRSVS